MFYFCWFKIAKRKCFGIHEINEKWEEFNMFTVAKFQRFSFRIIIGCEGVQITDIWTLVDTECVQIMDIWILVDTGMSAIQIIITQS